VPARGACRMNPCISTVQVTRTGCRLAHVAFRCPGSRGRRRCLRCPSRSGDR